MGRLFLRIFLWFWIGSTCLLIVLAASLLIARPELVSSWRQIRMTAMLHLGTRAIEAYEQQGASRASAVLSEIAQEHHFRVWLYGDDGAPIGAAAPVDARELVSRATVGDDVERASASGVFLSARKIVAKSGKTYVFVWESSILTRSPWQLARAQFLLRLIGLTLTGGLVCLWLTLYITRPIRTLRGAARQFAEGNLSVRISERREFQRRDELSELAREFDSMAERIEDLVVSQQRLLGDISHELRSPLARLSLALDLARRRVGAEDLPEHQRIEREIHRLNELIEQLLTLARLQGESRLLRQVRLDTIDLRELIHEVAQDARFEAEAEGKTVVVSSEVDGTLRGSRALLRSAIENVVRNAVRHAPEQSAVTMAMTRDDAAGRVAIVVTDRGTGVPSQALSRLFDPFYRVDEARDRESGGVGLGLAITRQAMLAHGGSATAENHPEGGLVVRLELPA